MNKMHETLGLEYPEIYIETPKKDVTIILRQNNKNTNFYFGIFRNKLSQERKTHQVNLKIKLIGKISKVILIAHMKVICFNI